MECDSYLGVEKIMPGIKNIARYNNSIFGWAGHTKEGKTFSNVSGKSFAQCVHWAVVPLSTERGQTYPKI